MWITVTEFYVQYVAQQCFILVFDAMTSIIRLVLSM